MSSAVSVCGISKRFRLGASIGPAYYTLRESIAALTNIPFTNMSNPSRQPKEGAANKNEPKHIWALKDVSFELEPGAVLGIIGRNGAGKSTLLKILSRITEPTEGQITLRGRVGSLLEVGTGFHHELTGRENIYLNGATLGMQRREINKKFDAIVDFADIERFLDTPVKRYSSGMFVRLAFAVAAHLEPEILIVDEVLAVGDASFQRKCLGKMNEVSRSGRTVLFVSHNMATVLNLCKKVAVLDQGQLTFLGECSEGVSNYVRSNAEFSGHEVDLSSHPNRRSGSQRILGKARLFDQWGVATNQLQCGEPLMVELEVDAECPAAAYHFGIGLDDNMGRRLATAATYLSDTLPEPGRHLRRFQCRIDRLPLAPGRYALSFNAGPREFVWRDFIDQALWLDVQATDFYGNGRMPNPEWGPILIRSNWAMVND